MWLVVRRAVVGVLLLIAAVALALNRPVARSVLLIGILSVSFAYVLAPLAGRVRLPYRRDRGPIATVWALLVIYLGILLVGGTVWILAAGHLQRQLAGLRSEMPLYTERARQRLEMVERLADRLPSPGLFVAYMRPLSSAASASIRAHTAKVLEEIRENRPLLPWLWLVPLIALLLVSGVASFRRSAVAHLPEGHLRWRGEEFFAQLNSVLAGYTRAQLWSCLVVGAVSMLGFWLIGVPYALLLGTLSGVLEFFPVVGPVSAAIAACTLVSGERLLILIAFLVAMRLAQDYLVYPRLAGRGMHLHPAAVVLAIFAGASAGGMLGVLAAIPFVGMASVTVRHWREYWAIENLLREHERQGASSTPSQEARLAEISDSAAGGATSTRDGPEPRETVNQPADPDFS